MTRSEQKLLQNFKGLIEEFLQDRCVAAAFKAAYVDLWVQSRDSKEHYRLNKITNNAIDRAFTALDCFCSDSKIRLDYEIDEDELKREIWLINNEFAADDLLK